MKKAISIILSIVMLLSIAAGMNLTAYALDSSGSCGDNATYTFDSESGLLTISGTGDISNSSFYECDEIKSVIINKGITSIGEGAFFWSSLTSIEIPNSVTSIGDYTFCQCDSLTSIIVDNDNPYYSSQDDVLFNKDKTRLIQYPCGNSRTHYTIPNSVTNINMPAFFFNSLTSIAIPNSVTNFDCGEFGSDILLKDVYYSGTKTEWEKIRNYEYYFLLNSTIHYNAVLPCNHIWDNGKITKPATATAEGIKTYTCTVCCEKKTETLAKLTAQQSTSSSQGNTQQSDKTTSEKNETNNTQTNKTTSTAKKVSLKLKKVTVKKSAKKLVLQATLKINGKPAKNKKVTFKFNGKKYTAKTNKKGVAKVTIKKSVLKKLKKGKKVTYSVTYGKKTVKRTVKVKK